MYSSLLDLLLPPDPPVKFPPSLETKPNNTAKLTNPINGTIYIIEVRSNVTKLSPKLPKIILAA